MLDYLGEVSSALLLVIAWPNILYPVMGTFMAMVPAFLPGANGMTLMAILLPLTLSWDPLHVMLLYGALVGGATFMGSVTAILFNVPGGGPTPQRCSTATRWRCAARPARRWPAPPWPPPAARRSASSC